MMSDRPNSTRNGCSLLPLWMLPASTATMLPSTTIRPCVWRPAIKRVYVAESDDAARERARLAYASYRTHFLKPLPGGRVDPEEIPRPARIDVDTAFASGALVVGTPATIREYLQRYAAETGANYFVGSFHWGDLSHQEACRSLELFASEAMPAVL